jgi:hypothetical protein
MLNWFQLTCHPTDKYIHWSQSDILVFANKLREAWDKIENKEALNILLEAAYNSGKDDVLDLESEDI